MATQAEAWVLYAQNGDSSERAELVRETIELREMGDDDVLAETIYGCWEGNMGHGILRKPIDICRARGEPKVVMGNGGVLRVLEVGKNVKTVKPGQAAVLFPSAQVDAYGFPIKIFGYDCPNTVGCLATKTVLNQYCLIPIPDDTKYSLAQWAPFTIRYITAWSNWELAYGTYRLMVGKDENPSPEVWGWGGGTTLCELQLANHFGCHAVMMSGNDKRIETIKRAGVEVVDRRQFGDLSFDDRKFAEEPEFRKSYMKAEAAFLKEVKSRTQGKGVQIFVDFIGTSVFRATVKALGRNSVVTTSGWKDGMVITFLRAAECIERHQHINTHYAKYSQGVAAVEFAEKNKWIQELDERIYSYDEVPKLANDFLDGNLGMYPVFAVKPQ